MLRYPVSSTRSAGRLNYAGSQLRAKHAERQISGWSRNRREAMQCCVYPCVRPHWLEIFPAAEGRTVLGGGNCSFQPCQIVPTTQTCSAGGSRCIANAYPSLRIQVVASDIRTSRNASKMRTNSDPCSNNGRSVRCPLSYIRGRRGSASVTRTSAACRTP
jgi:hypothetical protein